MGQTGDGETSRRDANARISIVTPTRNRANMIEKAVISVAAQGYPSVEHIIVDAASTDDTLERLGRYPHLRVISEPDRGLYDAYNKGLNLASGDIVAFLNDDDYYEDGVFWDIAEAFASPLKPEVVCGWSTGVITGADGSYVYDHVVREGPADRLTLRSLNLDPNELIINARFFDRRLFERVGNFDTRYPVGADWDLMIRVALHAPRVRYVPKVVHRYRAHAQQVSFGHDPEATYAGLQERLTILKNLLESGDLWPKDRRSLRKLNSWVATEGIGVALGARPRRWDRVRTFVTAGVRRDPVFLWLLGSRSVGRARRIRGSHNGSAKHDSP